MSRFTKSLATFASFVLLTGCQANPVTPQIGAPSAHLAARHVLDFTAVASSTQDVPVGGAEIWGINFGVDETHEVPYESLDTPGGGAPIWEWHSATVHNMSFTTSSAGNLEYVGNCRFIYTVPDGRALVINEIDGHHVKINGLAVGPDLAAFAVNVASQPWVSGNGSSSTTGTEQVGRIAVNYIFGPGQVIVLEPAANTTVAGYTCDPAMLGGSAKPTSLAK